MFIPEKKACEKQMFASPKTILNTIAKNVRRPGVEPRSTAWKATMLAITPPTLLWLPVLHSNIKVNILYQANLCLRVNRTE